MLLGEDRIIGFSTHSFEQALAANLAPVDYIAIGPIFQTSSKENPDPMIGVAALSKIRSEITKPLVAIGGITLQTVSQVLSGGADSIAIISDLLSAKDVTEQTRAYFQRIEGNGGG
jgi:thiamine-phosphate pyrophosphorylase